MANPENLVILRILVQTDAMRFGVPFCICLLFSYHAPFSPHTVRVCYSSTCARIAHPNTPALRYNEFLSNWTFDIRVRTKKAVYGLLTAEQKRYALQTPNFKKSFT